MQEWFFRSSLQNWQAQQPFCFQTVRPKILFCSVKFNAGCYEFKIANADWSVSYGAGHLVDKGIYQLEQWGGNLRLQIEQDADYAFYWNTASQQLHCLQIPMINEPAQKQWCFMNQKIDILQSHYTQTDLKQIQRILRNFQQQISR